MSNLKKVDNAAFKTTVNIGASKSKQVLWYLVNIVFFKNPLMASSAVKVKLLRLFGGRVGKGVVLKPSINIKYPWKLVIGDQTWIGEKVWVDNLAEVIIGNNACISQGAYLLTGNHNYKKTSFDLVVGSITIEDGVWIGAKSVVCPGIVCYSHSVLSVQSVASNDLEAWGIYRGNPAIKTGVRVIT